MRGGGTKRQPNEELDMRALGLMAISALVAFTGAVRAQDIDWNKVDEALGRKATVSGDVEAAMKTAAAIGDDRLQKQAQGYVIPDSFTHGSSEQRQRWFQTGLKQGTVQACNTFSATAQL